MRYGAIFPGPRNYALSPAMQGREDFLFPRAQRTRQAEKKKKVRRFRRADQAPAGAAGCASCLCEQGPGFSPLLWPLFTDVDYVSLTRYCDESGALSPLSLSLTASLTPLGGSHLLVPKKHARTHPRADMDGSWNPYPFTNPIKLIKLRKGEAGLRSALFLLPFGYRTLAISLVFLYFFFPYACGCACGCKPKFGGRRDSCVSG